MVVDNVIDLVDGKVTAEMNRKLTMQVTTKAIQQALFEMKPDKSLGYDGLRAAFYQHYWGTVGSQVCESDPNCAYSEGCLPYTGQAILSD